MKKIDSEIERLAINIVSQERDSYEDALCWVTDRVAFKMRSMIREFRKSYWGIFDEPTDPTTGRDKLFIKSAMAIVEDVLKNVDIDQKDVGFIARHEEGYDITEIVRACVKDYLSRLYFGEVLDETERQMLIDGTVVWKTWKEGKYLRRKTVDLLNFYIDPTEESIQSAYRVTERAIVPTSMVARMSGWKNTDGIKGSQSLNKNDGDEASSNESLTTGDYTDIWEMWGKIPKFMVTGKRKDMKEEIDGHIVISGLDSGDLRFHLVEENKNKDNQGNIIKPYEELRTCKLSGRWYGLGYVERILSLVEFLNATVNIRINRNYISQLGLFKIKKGAGITPQMLGKLPSNGAILVNDMDDIGQMNVNPVNADSYKDEEVFKEWMTKITSAYPISSGELAPSSASATATAIANTNSKSSYAMVKEAIGFFLERWIDRHVLPFMGDYIKANYKTFRILADDDKYKDLVDRVSAYYVGELLEKKSEKVFENGAPSREEIMNVYEETRQDLLKRESLMFDLLEDIITEAVDTKVKITNEDIDTQVTVSNLLQLAGIPVTEQNEQTIRQVYDLLGLIPPKFNKAPVQPQQMGQMGMTQPTVQNITTDAYTG